MSSNRTKQSDFFALGMDIGYSNMKLTMGCVSKDGIFDVDPAKSMVLPIGAAPHTQMPQSIIGEDLGALKVCIDDELWVAGVEPSKLYNWQRELHEDYPSSKAYRALFYAALVVTERQEIDVLITGLPVEQFHDVARREKLISSLEGTHQVSKKRSVTVKKVLVIPQPSGTYLHAIRSTYDKTDLRLYKSGTVIIFDPGFYSADWIIVNKETMQKNSSGTSTNAVSKLIETMSSLIRDDYAFAPCIDQIEVALQKGEKAIWVSGEEVDLSEYIKRASAIVATAAVTEIRESLRHGVKPDVCILSGGGGEYFESAVANVFNCKHVRLKDSVIANSSGFWYAGQAYCRKMNMEPSRSEVPV